MIHSDYPIPLPETDTWFAPAARSSAEQIQEMATYCLNNPITHAILDSVDGYVLILNEHRQVLAANPTVLLDLNVSTDEALLGLRPGEIFSCIHSNVTPGGCGTSKNCTTCGAVISLLSSLNSNQHATGECLMSVTRNGLLEAHEFTVRATPLRLAEYSLTVFVIHDISSTKRRDVLENIFIHDLNNIITGLRGWSEILIKRPADAPHIAQKIVELSTHLTREVENQRLLLQAERGELQVTFEDIPVKTILDGIRSCFSGYPPDKTHRLKIQDYTPATTVNTSQPLLLRVLANMVKNALEATSSSDMVRVRFEQQDNSVQFIVHNPGEIHESIALQIFKRSFSTKGTVGRGLGTYSMKLFGEQYLGGTVDFRTNSNDGTTFRITLSR